MPDFYASICPTRAHCGHCRMHAETRTDFKTAFALREIVCPQGWPEGVEPPIPGKGKKELAFFIEFGDNGAFCRRCDGKSEVTNYPCEACKVTGKIAVEYRCLQCGAKRWC